MSEPPLLPASEPPPELPDPPEPAPPPPSRPHMPLLPWLTGAGFLLLVVALVWVWRHPAYLPAAAAPSGNLERQIAALAEQVGRLEQRSQASVPDLAPLAARVATLEQKPSAQAPPVDLKPLEARIATLEQRPAPPPPPNLAPIEARLAALEQRPQPNLAPLEARIAALEKTAGRAAQVQAVQAARIALDAGQKLGNLPNAPPALARFAGMGPPTEAQLRLEFPKAAQAALDVARPDTKDEPLLDRLWSRAQNLVTIRQGDRVVVGNPVAGLLARAQRALDAGDLAGAVSAVDALQGDAAQAAAAQAMAPWLAQARSLLDARAALATWAANG